MPHRSPTTPPASAVPTPTPVYRRPGFDFSLTGVVYCGIMLFMGLAAVNVQASLLFGVFGLMIGIVLISGVLSKLVIRRVSIRRLLPDQATVGVTTLIHYTISNAKRFWATFSVTAAELDGVQGFRRQPQTYLLHAAARGSAAVVAEVVPKRRGITRLDRYQLSTSFPFGFIKRAIIRRQADSMLVFPAMASVDLKLLTFFRSAEMTGNNLRPKPDGNDEFYGLREYRPGESQRLIDWKRSARTGKLVSREMTQVSPPRIVVVVDNYNADGSAARATQVERSIAQAASLVEVAIESGLAVGLVVRASEWTTMSVKRGKRHKRDLHTVLAMLPGASAQRAFDAAAAVAQASKIVNAMTTIVLFTGGTTSNLAMANRRGGGISIGSESDEARRWFAFDPSIDFNAVGPVELDPARTRRLSDLFVGRRRVGNATPTVPPARRVVGSHTGDSRCMTSANFARRYTS